MDYEIASVRTLRNVSAGMLVYQEAGNVFLPGCLCKQLRCIPANHRGDNLFYKRIATGIHSGAVMPG